MIMSDDGTVARSPFTGHFPRFPSLCTFRGKENVAVQAGSVGAVRAVTAACALAIMRHGSRVLPRAKPPPPRGLLSLSISSPCIAVCVSPVRCQPARGRLAQYSRYEQN